MSWIWADERAPPPLVVLVSSVPAGLVVFGLVLALLFGSAALGARLPGFGFLPGLPRITGLDFGPDVIGPLPRLSREFLADALGEPLLGRLLADPVPRPPATVVGTRTTVGDQGPPPSPTPRPQSGVILPGNWDLRPGMAADRQTVPPGGVIRYTIIVSNVGSEAFRGEFVLTSHIPFGTTDVSPSPCGEPGVDPDPDNPCVQPSAPVAGAPNDNVHQVTFSFASTGEGLAPGEAFVRSFSVRVNPAAASGTRFSNHAHLDVAGDGEGIVTTPNVVVVVE